MRIKKRKIVLEEKDVIQEDIENGWRTILKKPINLTNEEIVEVTYPINLENKK